MVGEKSESFNNLRREEISVKLSLRAVNRKESFICLLSQVDSSASKYGVNLSFSMLKMEVLGGLRIIICYPTHVKKSSITHYTTEIVGTLPMNLNNTNIEDGEMVTFRSR
uniref:Uncharacterized protein n=1 Tax=Cucumis melo TaxID=3656 RepID=A0A9I9EBN8_CUCME